MSEPRRIVVTGASGNVGAGVLRALARHEPEAEVIGVCRRPPTSGKTYEGVRWHAVDLSSPTAGVELAPAMHDADVVIHLALAISPVRDHAYLYRANVLGTQAVLDAMVAAGVRQMVYASSLGIYAPAYGTPVAETWSTTGQQSSTYSRHKVMVESLLDRFELEHADTAVARFRPTVVVQREAASEIRSLYLGPLVPQAALRLLGRRAIPILPLPAGLALQFVHADDVGDAVVRMIQRRAQGSFNVAADVLRPSALAALIGARPVAVNPRLMRLAAQLLHRLHLLAVTPGWYDVATRSPLMDTSKAHRELGWSPAWSSTEAASELIGGLADGALGTSAALGWRDPADTTSPSTIERVHDASLMLWSALAVLRAGRAGRPGLLEAAAMAVNLIAGTPAALDRLRERRRDPVALLAPVVVGAAVLASLRGGWTPVAATAVLGLLDIAERRRAKRKVNQ